MAKSGGKWGIFEVRLDCRSIVKYNDQTTNGSVGPPETVHQTDDCIDGLVGLANVDTSPNAPSHRVTEQVLIPLGLR